MTGYLFHEHFLWHYCGSAALYIPAGGIVQPSSHCESPESKGRLHSLVEVSGLGDQLERIKPFKAEETDLLRFHTRRYLENVKEVSKTGGDAGEYAILSPGGIDIALLAAGGVIATTDAVVNNRVKNAYALVRPPGHHAEADIGRGFCIFANASVAIMKARAEWGVGRVLLLDWDVHHGNGAQSAFYDCPDVLTISVHQDRLFPTDCGGIDEIGVEKGKGFNINVPLPPGSGEGAYLAMLEQVVLPALYQFKPDLVMVSSGYDSCAADPLGRMMLNSESYRKMTKILMDAAEDICQGKLVMVHEGGYSEAYVPFCGLAVLEQLSGITIGYEDPFLSFMREYPYQELQPHQSEVIKMASEIAKNIK